MPEADNPRVPFTKRAKQALCNPITKGVLIGQLGIGLPVAGVYLNVASAPPSEKAGKVAAVVAGAGTGVALVAAPEIGIALAIPGAMHVTKEIQTSENIKNAADGVAPYGLALAAAAATTAWARKLREQGRDDEKEERNR